MSRHFERRVALVSCRAMGIGESIADLFASKAAPVEARILMAPLGNATPGMIQVRRGPMLHIASVHGFVGFTGFPHYAASMGEIASA